VQKRGVVKGKKREALLKRNIEENWKAADEIDEAVEQIEKKKHEAGGVLDALPSRSLSELEKADQEEGLMESKQTAPKTCEPERCTCDAHSVHTQQQYISSTTRPRHVTGIIGLVIIPPRRRRTKLQAMGFACTGAS